MGNPRSKHGNPESPLRISAAITASPELVLVVATMGCFLGACQGKVAVPAGGPVADWPHYGGDPGGSRYSPLNQISRDNVKHLKVAWIYHTGDVSDGTHAARKSEFEATPIVVEGTLYFSTAFNRVIALDPESGGERWTYDPKIDLNVGYSEGLMNRGVATWLDPARKDGEACRRRIFIGTIDARLIALDAPSGKPCADFGMGGQIDLKQGIAALYPGEYEETSPPAVIDDLVIVGSGIADNHRANMPSGIVRAFNARTGALRWNWDPIPRHPNDPAAKTWEGDSASRTGAANAWSIISVDPARQLIFVPTGSASPDYYGGERRGKNLYANSVVALHAATGEVAWYFQTVHHDLWDYDVASQPILITLRRNGQEIPAVAQGSKTGNLFVLHRESGAPIFPVEERPVPQTDVSGEQTSPTQPFPVAPSPLVPQHLKAEDAWGLTPWDRNACRDRMKGLRSEGIFTPPSVHGSLIFPGNLGGMNWSSAAFDPERQTLVTNTNRLAFEVHLIPRDQYAAKLKAEREGKLRAELAPQQGTPYGISREPIISPLRLPCNPPLWGAITAVNLSTGQIRWEVPLGTMRDYLPLPIPIKTGMPNLGGPIVTAAGLIFIGAAMDNYLRAFDIDTGKELWAGRLPAGAQATPMTYRLRGESKQYVVIAAGGHGKLGTKLGDSLVAFALP